MANERTVLVRVDEAMFKALAYRAVDQGTSKSALVRQWIKEGLQKSSNDMYRAMGGQS